MLSVLRIVPVCRADVVVQGANNPRVVPGAPGGVDASASILVLDVPRSRVDRSMGDVHPLGNPHYSLHPGGLAPAVTANILEGLVRVAPEYRPMFERNRTEFLGRVEQAMRGWSATLAPFKGAPVVVYHAQWAYLRARFGLTQLGTIEERPGTLPPRDTSPS